MSSQRWLQRYQRGRFYESEKSRLGLVFPTFFTPPELPATNKRGRSTSLFGPPWTSPLSGVTYFPTWFTRAASWWVQKGEKKDPLPFTLDKLFVKSFTEFGNNNYYVVASQSAGRIEADRELSYNRAYNKAVEQIGEQSQWAVNFYEYKQAVNSISHRGGQILRLFRSVRSLNITGILRSIGDLAPGPIPDRVSRRVAKLRPGGKIPGWLRRASKSGSNAWLEFHFFVEPSLKDIEAAIHTLNSTPPTWPVVGNGAWRSETTVNSGGYVTQRDTDVAVTRCRIGMNIRVSNPNAFLASQLGLTNAAAIAWEIVPWSFVLDWIGNVGSYLKSYTDFDGLTVSRSYTTFYQVVDRTRDVRIPAEGSGYTASFRSVFVDRVIGFHRPFLRFTPFRGFSVVRGATAISLLLQQLHR